MSEWFSVWVEPKKSWKWLPSNSASWIPPPRNPSPWMPLTSLPIIRKPVVFTAPTAWLSPKKVLSAMVTSWDSRTRMALSPRCASPVSDRNPSPRPVASMPTRTTFLDSEIRASGARLTGPPSSLRSATAMYSER